MLDFLRNLNLLPKTDGHSTWKCKKTLIVQLGAHNVLNRIELQYEYVDYDVSNIKMCGLSKRACTPINKNVCSLESRTKHCFRIFRCQ